jgi:hypothetical protein
MNMECKTQTSEVLKHLKEHGSITSIEAINLYGATRLSDIIYRLRRRGYIIETTTLVVKTKYGRHTSVGEYILHEKTEGDVR